MIETNHDEGKTELVNGIDDVIVGSPSFLEQNPEDVTRKGVVVSVTVIPLWGFD